MRRRYVHGERVGHDQLPGDFQGGVGGGQSGACAVATVWGNEVGCSLARAVRQVIKYFYYKLRYANEPMPPEFPIEPSMALELLMASVENVGISRALRLPFSLRRALRRANYLDA